MLTVLCGDALEKLRELPDETVQCCVTSPPYWGLRDYGTAAWEGGDSGCDHRPNHNNDSSRLEGGKDTQSSSHLFRGDCGKCGARRIDSQLGLEKTPEEYVAKLVGVMREVRRVLRKDGTLWLNLGDSYGARGGDTHTGFNERWAGNGIDGKQTHTKDNFAKTEIKTGLKPKDLVGIPWRVAFALQADGWWLRSDIIWAKPNPMPESVTDRPTKSHEYLFLLTKSANYFYDAEAIKEKAVEGLDLGILRSLKAADGQGPTDRASIDKRLATGIDIREGNPSGNRNKRSVWTVATAPYPEAHFATYPPDLIKPCIMAGTSAKGCCAKCGAPWERLVERGELTGNDRGGNYKGRENEVDLAMQNRMKSSVPFRPGMSYENKTLGWQPTCKCDAGVEPCVVLDCFAGSGTTGMVALELGRKAVLIELNPAYVKLIEQRCNVTMGLPLA